MQEFDDLNVNKPIEGVTVTLIGNELTQWWVYIVGPKDTPFEGGNFKHYIDFTDNYPLKRPKVSFRN